MAESKNYFEELNAVNVSDKIEKKNGLSYLSWAWAWGELKKRHPGATYTIYEDREGRFYHTDGRTCWVKTGVTVEGIEHIEYLPVMDMRNRSIPVNAVTSFDVNKAIQRSLTKAVARHGLGLYVYAGEDLPEEDKTDGIADYDGKVPDKAPAPPEVRHPDRDQVYEMLRVAVSAGMTGDRLEAAYGVASLSELTIDQYDAAMRKLQRMAVEKKERAQDDAGVQTKMKAV